MPSSVCRPLALAALLAVSVSVRATSGGARQASFYREWTMAELLPSVMDLGVGREAAKDSLVRTLREHLPKGWNHGKAARERRARAFA